MAVTSKGRLATHGMGQISLVPAPLPTLLAGERVGISVGITKDGFHRAPGLLDWSLRKGDAATTHRLIGVQSARLSQAQSQWNPPRPSDSPEQLAAQCRCGCLLARRPGNAQDQRRGRCVSQTLPC